MFGKIPQGITTKLKGHERAGWTFYPPSATKCPYVLYRLPVQHRSVVLTSWQTCQSYIESAAKLLSTTQGEGYSSCVYNFAYNPDGSTSTSMLKCQTTTPPGLVLSFLRLASEQLPYCWELCSCEHSSRRLCMASQALCLLSGFWLTGFPLSPSSTAIIPTRQCSCRIFILPLKQVLQKHSLILLEHFIL